LWKREISGKGEIPEEVIEAALHAECLDGRSFIDAENDIRITAVY